MIAKMSYITAFMTMKNSRCKQWDDRILDALDGYRGITFVFLQVSSLVLYNFTGAKVTPWSILNMKDTLSFTIIMTLYQVSDVLFALGGFLAAYKIT
jgi:hypothetical protein